MRRFVELSNGRIAKITYYFKALEQDADFIQLKDADAIPKELWEAKPHHIMMEVFYKKSDKVCDDTWNHGDLDKIREVLKTIEPPKNISVTDYFS